MNSFLSAPKRPSDLKEYDRLFWYVPGTYVRSGKKKIVMVSYNNNFTSNDLIIIIVIIIIK